MRSWLILIMSCVLFPGHAGAQPPTAKEPSNGDQFAAAAAADAPATVEDNQAPSSDPVAAARFARVDLKRLAEQSALANRLPVDYFVRLIGQESGFNRGVVSASGAQGIAQFMPATAQDRGVKDPFDPFEALPKSAALLGDLKRQFGNLGLAAAAYNAGAKRVREWLAARGHLPKETRAYVYAITGRSAEDWAPPGTRFLKDNDGEGWRLPELAPRSKDANAPKNWELALLLSIASTQSEKAVAVAATKPVGSTIARGRRAEGNHHRDGPRLEGERSLCGGCIVQNFY